MSEKIEVGAQASGEDGINNLVSAVDRLGASLAKLGAGNTALEKMSKQMAEMTKVMKSGFDQMIELQSNMDERAERQSQVAGERRLAQEASKADKRLQQQIAFEQKQEGAGNKFHDRTLDREIAFENRRAAETEKGLQAQLAARADAYAAQAALEQVQQIKLHAIRAAESGRLSNFNETSSATAWQNYIELEAKKTAAAEALTARTLALSEYAAAQSFKDFLELDAKKTAAVEALAARQRRLDESSAAQSFQNFLDLEAKKTAEAEAYAQRVLRLSEAAESQSWINFLSIEAKKAAAESERYARQMSLDEAAAARSWQNFLDLEAKKVSLAERNSMLNVAFRSATPAGQARIMQRGLIAGEEGIDPVKLIGTAAAAAAVKTSLADLAAITRAGGATAREAAAAHDVLNGVMKDAQGIFKGAAHEAGIYGLAHGQLITLLAGGALAAALHHVAATGAEVEYELANLNALSDKMNRQPLDIGAFISITSGTLSNVKHAAEGMGALAEAGFNQSRAMAALPDIMRLATLGNMSVAQSAELAVEAMHAFGKGAEDIEHIGDVLVAVGSKSNVSVHRLANDMKSAATTGELFHLSMEEITASVGVLAERGLTIQPLSSAMLKLYEPSAKTAAVMKEMKFSMHDSEGGLRNFTEAMGDLVEKMKDYKEPADVLKNMGFSSRDIKGMEAMTQHWEDYLHLLHEANDSGGKMFDAMLIKEDTVEGAFKRLGSTVDGSFTMAFVQASPVIRQVEEDLMRMAGSESTVNSLAKLAMTVARVTQVAVENASAIGTLVVAYFAMNAVTGLITVIRTFVVAQEAAAAATRGAAVAAEAQTARLALLTVEERAAALAAEQLAAASVVAGEGLTIAAAGARMLTGALGYIGIAITVATVAYEAFKGAQSENDKVRQEGVNTANTTIDAYDREIARLVAMENQLRLTGNTGQEAANKVARAFLDIDRATLEQKLNDAQKAPAPANRTFIPGRFGSSGQNGEQEKAKGILAIQKEITANEEKAAALDFKSQYADLLRDVTDRLALASKLKKTLEEMPEHVVSKVKTPEGLAAAADANERLKLVRAEAITENNALEIKKQMLAIEKDLKATRLDAPAAPAKIKGANDALNADIKRLEVGLQLEKLQSQADIANARQQNRRGELGDLQLINVELAEKLALDQKGVEVARQQAAATSGAGKLAKTQEFENKRTLAARQAEIDTAAAAEARQTVMARYDQEMLRAEAKTLTDKGQLETAFLKNYEAQYGTTINKVIADMSATTDAGLAAQLGSYLAFLTRLQNSGAADAGFKEKQQLFEAGLSQLQERMSKAKAVAAEDGGLSGSLGLAAAADEIRSGMLPALQQMVNQLQLVAKDSGSDALVTTASKAQTSLNTIAKDLTKAANPFGDAWTDAWKGVERAGHTAWMNMGKGGTNMAKEIGAALKTSVLEALYQLTIKKWVLSIGANLSSAFGLGDAAAAAGGASSLLSGAGTAGSLASTASGIAGGANIFGSLASGSGVAGQFLSGASGSAAAAAEALGAEMTTAAAAGNALGSAFATALPWVAAAGVAFAAWSAFMEDGPEQNTHLKFSSNNAAGNISINERGNEGKSDSYIGTSSKSALGTFGAISTLWMSTDSPAIKSFMDTVGKTDDALAMFMTAAEKASVSSYLTGKTSSAATGAEGSDPNKTGQLDVVFHDRISNIFEGLSAGMSGLIKDFSGTSQELATESAAILSFRQALVNGGAAVFGLKVTLEDVAAMKLPTELTSAALTRVTNTFVTTNQIAAIMGKTTEQMFGSIGLSSYKTRDSLVQATGGLDSLTKKVTSYSANFLTKADQTAQATDAVTKTMASLGLSSVTTKTAFASVVKGLDLVNSAADVQLFNSLMDVQQAFSDISTAAETAATALQDQIDALTLTRAEQLAKERDALAPANRALFDNLQIQKKIADARTDVATAYDNEVAAITAANDRLKTFGASLRTFRDGLVLGALSPLTPEQKYGAARSQFDSTLAKAQGGDAKAQDALQSAASAFLEASRVSNASGTVYTSDFDRVTAAMAEMATWADSQVDIGKSSLDQLKQQVGALVEIKAAVLTLPQALAALLAAQTIKPDQAQRDTLTSLYKDLLGRAPDASGFEYWMKRMTDGATTANVADEMRRSPEYAASHSAAAYDYAGMASDTSAVVAELQAVKAQLAAMQAASMEGVGAQLAALFTSSNESAKIVADAIAESARQAAAAEMNKVVIE